MRAEQWFAGDREEEPRGGLGSAGHEDGSGQFQLEEDEDERPLVRAEAGGGSRQEASGRLLRSTNPGPTDQEPYGGRGAAGPARAEPFGLPPPAAPSPSAARVAVAVLAFQAEEQRAVAEKVHGLGGFAVREGQPGPAAVALYAAHTARDLMRLQRWLGPQPPRGVLLDLEGAVGEEAGALLGMYGYLHPESLPWQQHYCLQQVACGCPYAAEPHDGIFILTRELGALKADELKLLSLLAHGFNHLQVQAALHVSEPTLKRRVGALRKRLALRREESLAVYAARRLGLG